MNGSVKCWFEQLFRDYNEKRIYLVRHFFIKIALIVFQFLKPTGGFAPCIPISSDK